MILFLVALSILIASSLPWVAAARLSSKPAWLMACYLVGSANVTLSLYVANGVERLHQPAIVLLFHCLLGAAGWLLWRRVGKPSVGGPFQGWRINLGWARSEPMLTGLALSVAISYLFAFVQIVLIPQNNMDSLSTHLTRIVFWRQHGSMLPWSTYMLNQVSYPVNAQTQTYWTLLFLGSDRLVGGAQWLAALVSGVGIFGLARWFGYGRRPSAFAALIFLTFPLVALQSTTPQTDLVTTVFFILAVYFLLVGLRQEQYASLMFSAVSVGLGLGVKKSFFLLLPLLALVAALAFFQYGRRSWKPLVIWSLNLVVGIVLFGAYTYVVNWLYLGDPLGSPTYMDTLLETPQNLETPQSEPEASQNAPALSEPPPESAPIQPTQTVETIPDSPPADGKFMEVVYNAPRLLYQALDTSGLPRPLDGYAHKVKMRVVRPFFQWIGFEEIEGTAFTAPGHEFSFADKNINEESHAWYGPLSFLLILPALFLAAWQAVRRKSPLLLMPGLAFLIFLPLEIVFRPGWDPFQGRYFAPIVALCAPLMAIWFREKGSAFHEGLIAGLAVVIMVVTFLYNPSKPTLGKFADEFHVWTNPNRIFVQTIQRKNDRRVYRMVERFVPQDATLGYHIPFFFMEYPLFGERLTRRLVPMGSPALVTDRDWQRAQGVEYLLLPDWTGIPAP